MKRIFLALLVLLLVGVSAWLWSNREHVAAFPQIISSYTAKEYCSCRYVSQMPAEYCQGYVAQWLPYSALVDDSSKRQVTVTGLGFSNTATWLSPRQGCALQAYQ